MDEPSADPSAVALYFVDQIAAEQVKAVLSGEGADEFFGGYRIYQTPFANEKLAWAPKGLLRGASKAARALGVRGANYLERASETPEDWYYTNANGVAFSPEERERLTYLRNVYSGLLVTGPFSILVGFTGGLMALNDRLKLRSMVVGEKGDMVYIASEESAIRVIQPTLDKVWAPAGGEPVIFTLDKK